MPINEVTFIAKMEQAIIDMEQGGKRFAKGEKARDTLLREAMFANCDALQLGKLLRRVTRLQVKNTTLASILSRYQSIFVDVEVQVLFITGQKSFSQAYNLSVDNRRNTFGWKSVGRDKLEDFFRRVYDEDKKLTEEDVRILFELELEEAKQREWRNRNQWGR